MEIVSRKLNAMTKFTSIRSLIDAWPTRRALAEDIGTSADRVHKWAASEAIPASFHAAVIASGQARGIAVDADLMVHLHAKPAATTTGDAA